MKYCIQMLFMLAHFYLGAQNKVGALEQNRFFDPERDPIALRCDTTLQLLVSEFVLAKSVKTRMGQDCLILKIYKSRSAKGIENLLFEGHYLTKNRQHFTLSIPLLPDADGRFYFASTQALVCSSPGCNNCSIVEGSCVGCCTSSNGGATVLSKPLVKVLSTIEK